MFESTNVDVAASLRHNIPGEFFLILGFIIDLSLYCS